MQQEDLTELLAFLAVVDEGSFTRASGKFGVSQSALSYAVRRLETRLGVRLLNRTTRSVAPTDAGERLVHTLRPSFAEIESTLAALSSLRETPAGSLRLTAAQHAADTVLWPALARLVPKYPEIKVEVVVDYSLTNIVAERFDAGVRLGEQVAKDMIAVRIGPDWRMAVVGTPSYFSGHPVPQKPQDLAHHNCINMRLSTSGGLMPWDFEKRGREVKVKVDGQLAFNRSDSIVKATVAGLGLGYVPEDLAAPYLATGALVSVLTDWCAPFTGYHLYYPSRRYLSPAFKVLIEELRYRG